MIRIKGLIATAALAAFAAACGQASQNAVTTNTSTGVNTNKPAASTPSLTPAPQVAAVKSGKDLYTINCMTCHKDSGKGGKVTVEGKQINPDDLTSAKMKAKSDEKLYAYIADGIVDEGMPAFKDELSKAEIDAVVKHLRDLQK